MLPAVQALTTLVLMIKECMIDQTTVTRRLLLFPINMRKQKQSKTVGIWLCSRSCVKPMEYPCAILDHHHYHTTVQQQFSPVLAQIMHNSKELCSVIMEGSRRDEKARFTSTMSCCLVCWRIAHCIVAHLNGMQNCLLSFTHMDGAGTVICFKTFHQSH